MSILPRVDCSGPYLREDSERQLPLEAILKLGLGAEKYSNGQKRKIYL